jgi:hypothetical protein
MTIFDSHPRSIFSCSSQSSGCFVEDKETRKADRLFPSKIMESLVVTDLFRTFKMASSVELACH